MADGSVKISVDVDGAKAQKAIGGIKESLGQMGSSGGAEAVEGGLDGVTQSGERANASVRDIVTSLGLVKAASMAFDFLKSSVEAAISRVDTIDISTKSLTVLTGSTKEATDIMDGLSNAIDGTPIALDQVANGAKKMVAAGMEGKKVEETFTAIADAAYGVGNGASSIDQITDAISSMQSAGTVYSDDINRLVDAGVPAWQILANQTGKSVGEMKTAVSNGTLESNDAISMLTQGIEKGTDGVAGHTAQMAGLAKTAGDSISGSFSNMKTAATKSLANIATALKGDIIDGLTGLQNMFKAVGEFTGSPEFAKWVERVADAAKVAAPIVATLFTTFGGGIATAALTAKAVQGISNAFTAISNHPIITIISLLATAFVAAYQNIKPFHDFVDKTAKALVEFASNVSQSESGMNAFKAVIGAVAGSAGLGLLLAGFVKFKSAVAPVSKGLPVLGNGMKSTAVSAGQAALKMVAFGAAVLEIGIGIGVAAAGIGFMAMGFAQLAATGTSGIIVIAAVTIAIAALAGIFALLGPILTASALGLGMFALAMFSVGAAVLLVGAGIALAMVGMALFATQLPIISEYGLSAALGIAALGLALIGFTAGALLAGAGLIVLAAGFLVLTAGLLVFTAGLLVATVGMLALGVSTTVFAVGLMIAVASVAMLTMGLMLLTVSLVMVTAYLVMAGAAALVFMAGLTVVVALTVLASASFLLLGAGLLVASAAFLVTGAALLVFSGALTIAALGTVLLLAGLAGVKASLSAINTSATSTANSLKQMVTSINVVKTGLDGMVASAKSAVSSFLSVFSGAVGQAKSNGTNLGNAVSDGVSSGLKNSTGQARSAMDSMMNAIKRSGNDGVKPMQNIGSMIGQGLATGMRSALGEVTAAANELVSQAEKAAKAKAEIHSPSHLMRDEVGYYIGAGMAVGMDKTSGLIEDSAGGLISNLTSRISKAAEIVLPSANSSVFARSLRSVNSLLAMTGIEGMTGIGTVSAPKNSVVNLASNSVTAQVEQASQDNSKIVTLLEQMAKNRPVAVVDGSSFSAGYESYGSTQTARRGAMSDRRLAIDTKF